MVVKESKNDTKKEEEKKPVLVTCPNCQKVIYNGELCTCMAREDNFKLLIPNEHDK